MPFLSKILNCIPHDHLQILSLPGVTSEALNAAGYFIEQADIGEKELEKIVQTGCSYRIDITGNRGLEYAQVTAGGADCSEFDPSTMQSRIIPGLFAAGETMNVDGDCGGYNLMFAFASGLLAGSAV